MSAPKSNRAHDEYTVGWSATDSNTYTLGSIGKHNIVIAWITHAQRPLTTSELQHALGVEVGEPELDREKLAEIEDLISVCAGLVTVDEESDIIWLVHYTTQEYFERTQNRWIPDAEINITKVCLSYLSFDAIQSGACRTFDELEERMQLNQLYSYAAQNWGKHALKACYLCPEIVLFLNSKSMVEAAGQALTYSRYSKVINAETTGFHLAAFFGIPQAMEALLQKKVKEDAKTVACRNGNADDLDCKDKEYGQTPLSWAAKRGQEAVVRLLLDKGANLEAKGHFGRTPLLLAVERGEEAVVRLLLEKGVDFEFSDSDRTAFFKQQPTNARH